LERLARREPPGERARFDGLDLLGEATELAGGAPGNHPGECKQDREQGARDTPDGEPCAPDRPRMAHGAHADERPTPLDRVVPVGAIRTEALHLYRVRAGARARIVVTYRVRQAARARQHAPIGTRDAHE